MEIKSQTILTGYSDQEKGAYLGVLASLATADRQASPEEIEQIKDVAHSAGLSSSQEAAVIRAATELSGEELIKCLDILKSSNLRFSLITDLIALAEADASYTEDEKKNIEKISQYLQIDQKQFSLLDQFVHKAAEKPEEVNRPGFLESLGLKDQFAKAGVNPQAIGKGLLGMLGPILLGTMAAKAMRGRGMGGSLGGMLGGNSMGMGVPGGFGSILSGLNRSRNTRSMGGLLGRLL